MVDAKNPPHDNAEDEPSRESFQVREQPRERQQHRYHDYGIHERVCDIQPQSFKTEIVKQHADGNDAPELIAILRKADIAETGVHEQANKEGNGDDAVSSSSKQTVNDVATIELSDRQQVQARNEERNECREQCRIVH